MNSSSGLNGNDVTCLIINYVAMKGKIVDVFDSSASQLMIDFILEKFQTHQFTCNM